VIMTYTSPVNASRCVSDVTL